MDTSLLGLLIIIVISLFSIIFHEVAHGYVAYLFKDKTAYHAGRLTLNPVPHIDLIGSIVVPIFSFILSGTLFGWAKPVPVNPRNLVGKYADFWVSAAGVLMNLSLALTSLFVAHYLNVYGLLTKQVAEIFYALIIVNLSLFVFNLIPIPPFDGMSILQGLFPKLRIKSTLIYNPLYMLGAIIVASYVYSAVSPFVFNIVLGAL